MRISQGTNIVGIVLCIIELCSQFDGPSVITNEISLIGHLSMNSGTGVQHTRIHHWCWRVAMRTGFSNILCIPTILKQRSLRRKWKRPRTYVSMQSPTMWPVLLLDIGNSSAKTLKMIIWYMPICWIRSVRPATPTAAQELRYILSAAKFYETEPCSSNKCSLVISYTYLISPSSPGPNTIPSSNWNPIPIFWEKYGR